jgi:hypothetical protein
MSRKIIIDFKVLIIVLSLVRIIVLFNQEEAMATITANELKTRGISAIDPIVKEHQAALISVRGKIRYVVMDMQMYNRLRECELEAALMETHRDLEKGEFYQESVAEHIKRIANEL